MPPTIKLYDALKRMRSMTELGIPFEFEFLSFNSKSNTTDGYKSVSKAQLRKGYRDDQSSKADILIGYVNAQDGKRWFYLPLLTKFNGHTIQP
jgi:hypothetical protein